MFKKKISISIRRFLYIFQIKSVIDDFFDNEVLLFDIFINTIYIIINFSFFFSSSNENKKSLSNVNEILKTN